MGLGNSIWNQYRCEHKIAETGMMDQADREKGDDYFLTFFEETAAAQFVPRNIYVDLEPTVMDDVRRGPCGGLFHPEYLVNAKEDAANNFARGHYTVGKELMDIVSDRLRKLVDNSENVQGFMATHSVGGGTGSGMGMLILERLAVDYRKKSKIGFEIYPSPNISTCIVEPYNGLLSTHWLLDHTDVSLVLDNEALNYIICKVVSSMTAAIRFDGELNVDMNEFQTNLVPFPRLHFMTTSLAPIVSKKKADHEAHDCRRITDDCLQSNSFLVKYSDFDVVEDKYMAISLNYRGEIKSKVANATVQWVKTQGKVSFVEWCPTGFKIGLNDVPAAKVTGDGMAP